MVALQLCIHFNDEDRGETHSKGKNQKETNDTFLCNSKLDHSVIYAF